MIEKVSSFITESLTRLGYKITPFSVQSPNRPELGDIASNVALTLAKELKMSPMVIAETIIADIQDTDDNFFSEIHAAKPGFINFRINPDYYYSQLKSIFTESDSWGKNDSGNGKRALVEFVSANPTGPLTVGHGRGAVLGDCVSSILDWNGFDVQREYYFNNAGRQMKMLGLSVYNRYLQICGQEIDFPEDYYQGDYIKDIAATISEEIGSANIEHPEASVFRDSAEKLIFDDIKKTLKDIHLVFDSFFNEKELYDNGSIQKILDDLKALDLIYSKDNATWFKGTTVGREADKVLVKSTGEPTYRLPDMAYHREKIERGYDKIVDVFGADHADAYPDVLAVLDALDNDTTKIEVLIHQFVTIYQDGEQVKMSTRKANFISLDQLIEDVGADVVRYFFIMRGMNTHLNFDLNLARDHSDMNPVFYLQYAHARVCSIMARAKAIEIEPDLETSLDILTKDIELRLIRKLLDFPVIVRKSAISLEPQSIATYLQETASIFHKFYAHERVISDDAELTAARMVLIAAFRIVIFNGLTLLGLSAPEKM